MSLFYDDEMIDKLTINSWKSHKLKSGDIVTSLDENLEDEVGNSVGSEKLKVICEAPKVRMPKRGISTAELAAIGKDNRHNFLNLERVSGKKDRIRANKIMFVKDKNHEPKTC